MIRHTFIVLLNLLRLRPGPQQLPASWALLLLLFLMDAGMTEWVQSLTPARDGNGLMATAIGFSCSALVAWVALRLRGHGQRLLQTLTALLLLGLAFTLLSIPLLLLLNAGGGAGQADQLISGAQAMMFLALIFWSLFASGSVFRHALSTSLAGGVLVATLILLVQAVVFDLLLPTTS